MKVLNLKTVKPIYSSNVYLVLGEWNKIDDVNTLIDAGADVDVVEFIKNYKTGVVKKSIDQVIMTHSHFDHSIALANIVSEFNPKVIQSSNIGENTIKIADEYFDVYKISEHSEDSILLYSPSTGIVFSGDTSLEIRTSDEVHSYKLLEFLRHILSKGVSIIYPGHGPSIQTNINEFLKNSILNIEKCKLI